MARYTITLDDENPPLLDPGHDNISTEFPGSVVVGKVPADGREHGFFTLRLPNLTLHVPLDRAGIAAWHAKLDELDRQLADSSSLIIPGAPRVLPGQVRPGR
jgi:hypothetical protein